MFIKVKLQIKMNSKFYFYNSSCLQIWITNCFNVYLGTRAEINQYQNCNLGKVKANALVTRGGYAYNETEINAFINLFIYAQQFYGRKDADEFR